MNDWMMADCASEQRLKGFTTLSANPVHKRDILPVLQLQPHDWLTLFPDSALIGFSAGGGKFRVKQPP